jgi:hypothetical protein
MHTQQIPDNAPAPVSFHEYAKTFPLARNIDDAPPVVNTSLTCQQVLDAGGCTLEEFFDRLDALIDKWPD